MRSQSHDRCAYHPNVVDFDESGRNPLSTNSIQEQGYPIFRVHHQRGAEPYTLGRGGRQAVEVDFRRNIVIRRQSRTPQVPTNERTYAKCNQYTQRDRLLPNQYTQHTLTRVTATDEYTTTTLTPVVRDRTNPSPLPPFATYGRPYNLLRLASSILPILRVVHLPWSAGYRQQTPITNTNTRTRHPRQSPMFKMLRRKRRRVPRLPMVHATNFVRLKG